MLRLCEFVRAKCQHKDTQILVLGLSSQSSLMQLSSNKLHEGCLPIFVAAVGLYWINHITMVHELFPE